MSSFDNFIDDMFPPKEKRNKGYTSENFTKSSRVLYEKDIMEFKEGGVIDETYARVWQKNLSQYEKICDHVGEDILILGSKNRRIENLDDVVTVPLAGWNVYTVVGKAGCGKSVLGSFLAEQLYYFTSLPSIFHDRANEFFYHKYPQKNPQILRQLYSLGFEAMGMKDNLLTITPYFFNAPYADVQWGIYPDDIYELGEMAGKEMFNKFLGIDTASSDVSMAAMRAGEYVYKKRPRDMSELMKAVNEYNDSLRQDKMAANISSSFFLFLDTLRNMGIFIKGQRINFAELLNNRINIDFITSLGAAEMHELQCYEAFLAYLVYHLSTEELIPNVCEVFEEIDIVLKAHNQTMKRIMDRKVLKERKQGNASLFITQDVNRFPDNILLNSKAVISTKPTSKDAMDKIAMKNPTADVYYQLELLDEPKKPAMPQWAVVTEYDLQTFYTLGSFGATHEVHQRR